MTSFLSASFGQQFGWRGPDRTGIYNEKGLMKSWPEKGPSLLWEVSGIGKGYSSATVTDDAIYITGTRGDKDVLTAFSLDGKKKWDVEYGEITNNVNSPESRSTQTYSNGKILVVSGQGDKEKLDIISSFRIEKGDGPYWSHPVIDKGRLFVRHGDYMAVYSLKAKV